MSEIIKTPHYYIRCPLCGCHFAFELEDFTNKGSGYLYKDYISCPYCKQTIQVRNTDTHTLLPNVKIDYTGGKLSKKTVTVADWTFPEDRFESVAFYAQKRDDEYEVDYVFEIRIKGEEHTISTVDKVEARRWATQLNIDLQAWEQEIKEVLL